jgi:hypothetical protein
VWTSLRERHAPAVVSKHASTVESLGERSWPVSQFLASRFLYVPCAQQAQTARVRGIGLVVGDDPEGVEAAFRETLHNQGYIEGQNLLIEARYPLRSAPHHQ